MLDDSELYMILRASDIGGAWEVIPFFWVRMCLVDFKWCWFILTSKEESLRRGESGCLAMQRHFDLFLFLPSSKNCMCRQTTTLGKLGYTYLRIFYFYPLLLCSVDCSYMATRSVRSTLCDLFTGKILKKKKKSDHPARSVQYKSLICLSL